MTFFRANHHLWIIFGQLVQNVDFQLGRLSVLLHVLDNLERNYFILVDVTNFNHLSKRAFSECGEDFEPVLYKVPVRIYQVPILVILDDRPLAASKINFASFGRVRVIRQTNTPVVPVIAAGAARDSVVVAEAAIAVSGTLLLVPPPGASSN